MRVGEFLVSQLELVHLLAQHLDCLIEGTNLVEQERDSAVKQFLVLFDHLVRLLLRV